MKIYFFLLIVCLNTVACKNDKNNSSISNEQLSVLQNKGDNSFEVIINAKVLVTDYFEVYYYEEGMETFVSNDYVLTKVVGNGDFQDIIFTLPKDVYPERLRLDFGKTTEQMKIQLNSIKLAYASKIYEFSGREIADEFKPSKYIDFDPLNLEIKTREIEGRYDPYLYSPKLNNIVNYLLED